jgi:transposase
MLCWTTAVSCAWEATSTTMSYCGSSACWSVRATLPPSVRIFVGAAPVDMRRSFDGLAAVAMQVVGRDPRSGHLFVFFGRARDRVKVLFWDRTGYCLLYKRLEKRTFRLPVLPKDATAIELESADLALILEGIDLAAAERHRRYRSSSASATEA